MARLGSSPGLLEYCTAVVSKAAWMVVRVTGSPQSFRQQMTRLESGHWRWKRKQRAGADGESS